MTYWFFSHWFYYRFGNGPLMENNWASLFFDIVERGHRHLAIAPLLTHRYFWKSQEKVEPSLEKYTYAQNFLALGTFWNSATDISPRGSCPQS